MDREARLATFQRLLNTPDGQELMDDLRVAWGSGSVFDQSELRMAYNAALLDCFRELEAFQSGARRTDEVIVNE